MTVSRQVTAPTRIGLAVLLVPMPRFTGRGGSRGRGSGRADPGAEGAEASPGPARRAWVPVLAGTAPQAGRAFRGHGDGGDGRDAGDVRATSASSPSLAA